jgi:hypothetical protein
MPGAMPVIGSGQLCFELAFEAGGFRSGDYGGPAARCLLNIAGHAAGRLRLVATDSMQPVAVTWLTRWWEREYTIWLCA